VVSAHFMTTMEFDDYIFLYVKLHFTYDQLFFNYIISLRNSVNGRCIIVKRFCVVIFINCMMDRMITYTSYKSNYPEMFYTLQYIGLFKTPTILLYNVPMDVGLC